jgi:hypothetical protein
MLRQNYLEHDCVRKPGLKFMSTATITPAVKAYNDVLARAEEIKNDAPHSMENMEHRDEWRQGDVRVIRLPDDFIERNAANLELLPQVPAQVAPGNTLGSRHTWQHTSGLTAYKLSNATVLDSPVYKVEQDNALEHPEHGDCQQIPAGVYSFPGQRTYAMELKRVAD